MAPGVLFTGWTNGFVATEAEGLNSLIFPARYAYLSSLIEKETPKVRRYVFQGKNKETNLLNGIRALWHAWYTVTMIVPPSARSVYRSEC